MVKVQRLYLARIKKNILL
jgi:hypothetical protein